MSARDIVGSWTKIQTLGCILDIPKLGVHILGIVICRVGKSTWKFGSACTPDESTGVTKKKKGYFFQI